jgi:outer membrane protein assembly factor BamB
MLHFQRQSPPRSTTFFLAALATLALSGCSALSFFSSTPAKPKLPAVSGGAAVDTAWTVSLGGKHNVAISPVVADGKVFAAHPEGTVVVVDEKTGAPSGRITLPAGAGRIGAGVGVGGGLVIVSTQKAEVFAFDLAGGQKWRVRIPTESIAPAAISEGVVVLGMVDGNIIGLNAADGSRKWVIQRQIPALTLRAGSIPVATRGGAFIGTPTGRLLAFDLATGAVGWEATVANPKGTSELERLIDVAGRPALDAQRACAAAYQGRVACFDIARGTPVWSRDIGSLTGVVADDKFVYVTDDKGVAYSLDRATGGTIWKQDVLAGRIATGVALVGDFYVVHDNEGNVNAVRKSDGRIAARNATGVFANGGLAQGANLAYAITQSGQLIAISAR